MRVLLPEIKGVFGLWKINTKAEASSIPEIVKTFDHVQEMAGTIVGVPFDLQVEKVKSNKPGKKNTFPVMRLVPNISQSNILKLREFKDQGVDLRQLGMLTDDRINEIQPKQLTSNK